MLPQEFASPLSPFEIEAMLLSLKVGVRSMIGAMPIAIALAWVLARHDFIGKSLVDALLHLPLVLPPVSIGFILLILFGRQGWVGKPLADWFGIKQIVCSETSADQYNSKVVQATMGSIARVSVVYRDLNDWLSALPDTVILATTLDGAPVQQAGKMTAGILIIGNESKGISAEVLSHATKKITIPRKGHAESLNAAIAAGIILSHIV